MKRLFKLVFGHRPDLGSVKGVSKVKTIYPTVCFSVEQHRAHLTLLVKRDFAIFNNYVEKALSPIERKEVLDCLTLNQLA